MCLILFAWRQRADYPLVLIANRDEFYARPTRAAHWWRDAPVFGGRDLEAGGTWLGVSHDGRIAAVTNVREPGGMKAGKRSRGELTHGYLAGSQAPEAYLRQIAGRAQEYSGFNLMIGDSRELWFYSNRAADIRCIEPGVHGISNGAFDEPWPKLASGKSELAAQIAGNVDSDKLLEILTDHRVAEDHELPSTGVTLDIERMLSSRFIRSPEYGTRASSVLLIDDRGQIDFREYNFDQQGPSGEPIRERFEIEPRSGQPR